MTGDCGGQLSRPYRHEDCKTIWSDMVKEYVKQWAIQAGDISVQNRVGGSIARASLILRRGRRQVSPAIPVLEVPNETARRRLDHPDRAHHHQAGLFQLSCGTR
jgi:hypothetical protein